MEKWKKITDFNERYSISDKGNVRNDERGSVLKPMVSTSGYHFVHLVVNRKKHTRYIHRLVGQALIENPFEYPQIDHVDGCKTNNDISNLRWVSVSENRLAYGSEQRSENRKRSVIARNVNGNEIIFDSRKEAAEHFNCSPAKIKYGHTYKKSDKKGWSFERL